MAFGLLRDGMMKYNFFYLFSLLFSLSACTQGSDNSESSWWMSEEFNFACEDKITNYLGNSEACYSLLSEDGLSSINPKYLEKVINYGFEFQKSIDLDSDGRFEFVAVGVFFDKDKLGRFLVISNDPKLNDIVKIFTKYGSRGFSGLKVSEENNINWFFCMECDDRETLVFTKNGYFLE